MKKLLLLLVFVISILFIDNAFAGRWCCSHHGWQAYCWNNWMWQCNDGTQSPSCTCSSPRKTTIESSITPQVNNKVTTTPTTSTIEKVATQSAISTIASNQTKESDNNDSNAVWYVLLWWASVYWYSKLKK